MSIQLPTAPPSAGEASRLRDAWLLFLVLGLISIVVGFLAISSTFVATMASVVVFGVLLLVAGLTDLVHGILLMVRKESGSGVHLLTAGLYLVTGVVLLEHPVRAAAVITLLMAAAFLVGGVLRIVVAVVERFPSWGWVVVSGVVNLVLGAMILAEWPESSLWVIGLFLGIDLIFHGWAWVILALTLRSVTIAPNPAA